MSGVVGSGRFVVVVVVVVEGTFGVGEQGSSVKSMEGRGSCMFVGWRKHGCFLLVCVKRARRGVGGRGRWFG